MYPPQNALCNGKDWNKLILTFILHVCYIMNINYVHVHHFYRRRRTGTEGIRDKTTACLSQDFRQLSRDTNKCLPKKKKEWSPLDCKLHVSLWHAQEMFKYVHLTYISREIYRCCWFGRLLQNKQVAYKRGLHGTACHGWARKYLWRKINQ